MMVTFVSQCEKKALKKTRRVLDAFANRIGDNTWQTIITEEGLKAVKKLLRKTATKNTAVSCHWIRSRSRSHFLWVVGNRNKFNEQGYVPVNYTEETLIQHESMWNSGEAISILAGIAGLFHDFGKANLLFQNKLDADYIGKSYEPYRHEWISLRVFQAFVNSKSDQQWLRDLSKVNNSAETQILDLLHKDPKKGGENPLFDLPPLARVISWLIVSHHRLPIYYGENHPSIESIDQWIQIFDAKWNSKNIDGDWDQIVLDNNWIFPNGTPFKSATWQIKAASIAERAISCKILFDFDWINQKFTSHLARMALMLADHFYSSEDINRNWQDRNFQSYANTDRRRRFKQKLDEHNIGVSVNGSAIANCLPELRIDLPALSSDRRFKQRVSDDFKKDFGWQDKAFEIASKLRDESKTKGFFGLNMASTGKGKTRGNARIMYALSEEKTCRFSIALGLRTLTLQTGDALQKHMEIDHEELAVLVGSRAVKQLHDLKKDADNLHKNLFNDMGSESSDPLIDEGFELRHNLLDYKGRFSKWIGHDEKLHALIQAPVLVSTIDYLTPATEGIRGGRQIAPMLRLLTSDLVLDEPDDFGLEDLPALCRLVNWAGMLGSKVLLSTATMSPAIAYALFEAYQEGRKHYTKVVGEQGQTNAVCCAWFDEFNKPSHTIVDELDTFKDKHTEFIQSRLKNLAKENLPIRKAKLVQLEKSQGLTSINLITNTIYTSIYQLHRHHQITHSTGKSVSIGLVRMANINPLVAVAKKLHGLPTQKDYRFYICVYHSQYPLAFRSHIESRLDKALARHNEEKWWRESGVETEIVKHPEKNHIFIVLATPVAEVGRDHDYDWAIVEPSSMRSLIQLAGRIQRHRKQVPIAENFYILSTNRRALVGHQPAFCKPGFETQKLMFSSHNLQEILKPECYKQISSAPRIEQPSHCEMQGDKFKDFVQLEHIIQNLKLFGNKNELNSANLWWKHSPTWCGMLQKMQPFRESVPNETFCMGINYQTGDLNWQEKNTYAKPIEYIPTNKIVEDDSLNSTNRNQPWLEINPKQIIGDISKQMDLSEGDVCKRFTEVQLPKMLKYSESQWRFSNILGIYKDLKKEEN